MNKRHRFSIGTTIAVTIVFYFTYYLLLSDSFFHVSVARIISESNELSLKQHLLVLGLVPIYIAAMVFGAAMLGVYLGSALQSCFNRFFKNKKLC